MDMDNFDPFKIVGCAFGGWILMVGALGIGTLITVFYLINKLIEKL